MSPHAEIPDSPRSFSSDDTTSHAMNGMSLQTDGMSNGHINGYSNGHTNSHANDHANDHTNADINGHDRLSAAPQAKGHGSIGNYSSANLTSLLEPCSPDEMLDLICVGFGPASLAIAVALHDSLETTTAQLNTTRPKVAFLERQAKFAWHAGMQIPGAMMQISFVKDLATLRNPRSEFTFINYLHRNDRLVQFTNLGTFLPLRVEYEDYMRWCASHFEDLVSYGQEVVSVDTVRSGKTSKTAAGFSITSRDINTGDLTTRRARNVVIATGGRPRIPASLPQKHPRVLHSSQYKIAQNELLADPSKAYRIAVIGGGQSAAEIFNDLPSRFPNSTSVMLIRDSALRPSDDSPFVNEIFDPPRVNDIFAQEPQRRRDMILADKPTNYGVVRLELLEHIYKDMYNQRLTFGSDTTSWPRRILPHRSVTGAIDTGKGLRLAVENTSKHPSSPLEESLDVDLVFVGSGYERDMHESMLQNCRHLMPGGDEAGKKWSVGRNYKVDFADGAVADDAGVWLQGCNELTHGLSDTLLSILSVRGGEMVENIFGRDHVQTNGHSARA